MAAYKIHRTGANVEELLDMVDNKTIYNPATTSTDGLMSSQDKTKLDEMSDIAALTNLEIENLLR